MAIKRPDIYEHNNPSNAIVDSDFVRGGFRTSVESPQELFNLDVKSDQLKEYATFVYVKSEEKVYTLVDKDNIGNINGWSTSVVVSGTSLQSDWEQQDSQEADYIKNKPAKTSDFRNDGEDGTAPYLTATDIYRQNAILRGEYYHIEDFHLFFWTDLYVINNTAYDNYISEEITIEPSDPIYDRIDVVVVNNDETISVITGTPSITPIKPNIDPTTQVEFTFFLVKAGSTTMDEIQTLVVYDENLQIVGGETNTSKNTTRVTLDSNEQSYSGDVSVKYQNTQIGDKSTYRFDSLQNLSEYSKIIFFVYQDLQGAAAENYGKMRFNIVFKTQNSNDNIRVYNSYVYYENITNEWSPLILSIGDSTIGNPSYGEDFLFDLIEITTLHSGLTFYIDYIVLQTGNSITQPSLIQKTSQIPINDGNTGDSRYVEEKDLTDVIIKKYYDNISDMIYDQPNQTKGQLLIVKDAIADSNLEFSSGETRRQATYQYEETTTGTIVDYKVLAVPFGGISGGGGDMMSSMYDPTEVEGDAFDFDNFYNVPDFEEVVNRRENLNNPDHLTYPTTKAVLDAISSSGGGDMLKSEYDPTNTEGDVFDFTNMHSVPPFLEDAPSDGKQYGRKDGVWEEIDIVWGATEW